jgi:hypothetical protein
VQHEIRQSTFRLRGSSRRLDTQQPDTSDGLHLERAAIDDGRDERRLRPLERHLKLRNGHDRDQASTHYLHWQSLLP